MPMFTGLASGGPQHLAAVPSQPTDAGPAATTAPVSPDIIDGTPIRLAVMALAAAAGLWGLKAAGFRFTVTAST